MRSQRNYTQGMTPRKNSNRVSEYDLYYNSRRRVQTQAFQTVEAYPRRRKLIQSSVFLPSIKNKYPNQYSHVRRHSNPYEPANQSEFQTMQCLQQCQKILDNLRRLTSASYKKQMRKNQRSFSLADEQQQMQTMRKYKKGDNRSPRQDKQILHIGIPESPKKYENKKPKEKVNKFLNSPVISIEQTPMQNKRRSKKANPAEDSSSYQKKYNKNSRKSSIKEKNQPEKSRASFFEDQEQSNEFDKNYSRGQLGDSKGPNSYRSQALTQMDNKSIEKTPKIGNRDNQKDNNQNGSNQGQKEKNQLQEKNKKSKNLQKQKTMLKYLMRAKDRGSILNSKVSTHLNKKYEKGSHSADKFQQPHSSAQKQNKRDQNAPKPSNSSKVPNILQIDGNTGDPITNVQQYEEERTIAIQNILDNPELLD